MTTCASLAFKRPQQAADGQHNQQTFQKEAVTTMNAIRVDALERRAHKRQNEALSLELQAMSVYTAMG